ncbi:hypothetical protein V474_20870 [Novosphingobium barchaimii LL02]|uniref:Glycosyltransferase RgtA/B/C/D-like domain-containing protein n=1 Tax=Novosphingobium barchaimii LL02 TaxID=1114963 RepID=A0A0J7XRZ9_9SPHN|nr:hypothetical protein [Novosphingobium barchaimii]KMS54429.1 hypothetical protein V474_20870 [Novosphingobium barchaimii LL02]
MAALTRMLTGGAAILLLLAFYARWKTLAVTTFDGDEYAFALVARDILQGKLPYTGIFDNKPVGLNYLFALAQALGGQTVAAIHALGLVSAALAAAVIYFSTRRLQMSRAVALGLAALFATETLHLGGWASMSELVALPFLCLANYLTLEQPLRWQSILARGVAISFGFVAALALAWLPQLLSGDLQHYLAEQAQYHGAYRSPFPPLWLWRSNFIEPLSFLSLPTVVACVLYGIAHRRLRFGRAFWLLSLQLIGAVLANCASNRLYIHYLILALPAAALLPAAMLRTVPLNNSRWLALAVLACAAFHQISLLRALPDYLVRPSLEADAARLIESRTLPNSAIMVFNAQHTIYYLSHRPAATRFVFQNHYLSTCDGAPAIKSALQVLQLGLAEKHHC